MGVQLNKCKPNMPADNHVFCVHLAGLVARIKSQWWTFGAMHYEHLKL